jgi:hypothetical protein
MVWLSLSPIPVGRRGVISSFKWFFYLSSLHVEERGRESAPCDYAPTPSAIANLRKLSSSVKECRMTKREKGKESSHYCCVGWWWLAEIWIASTIAKSMVHLQFFFRGLNPPPPRICGKCWKLCTLKLESSKGCNYTTSPPLIYSHTFIQAGSFFFFSLNLFPNSCGQILHPWLEDKVGFVRHRVVVPARKPTL